MSVLATSNDQRKQHTRTLSTEHGLSPFHREEQGSIVRTGLFGSRYIQAFNAHDY